MITKPYPYQEKAVRLMRQSSGRVLLADDMGLGKAQPLDAKILTPIGWSKMGLLRVGDLVIGSDGKPTPILAIYPQGIKQTYKVKFRDGAVTECCEEHLWAAWSPSAKWQGRPPRIRTTREMLDVGVIDKFGNPRFQIPIVKPVEFVKGPVPIDGYVLGILLGDGHLGSAISFTTADKEVVEQMQILLPGMELKEHGFGQHGKAKSYRIKNPGRAHKENYVVTSIKSLGLSSHRSWNKFIPGMYLYNSTKVRLDVLQGLMDSDGYASQKGVVQFNSTSKQLTRDVRDIVRSLGGTCKFYYKQTNFTHKGEKKDGRPSYQLTIALPEGIQPFRLTRKSDLYKGRPKYQPCRPIISITKGKKKACQCIRVAASDHLYVTNGYVLTHNTLESLLFVEETKAFPFIVICPAGLKYNWQNEIRTHLGIRADILEGMKPDKWSPFINHKALIVNYDILGPWRKYLIKFKKQFKVKTVVVDECKAIKSSNSIRNKEVRIVCKRVPNIIMADGTPLENRPSELWPALNILWPDVFPSFFDYGCTYCEAKFINGKWEYKGAQNLDKLHVLLKECGMIRRTKQQVLKHLPLKTRVVVPLEVSNRKEYRQAETDFVGWARSVGGSAVFKAMRATAFTKVGYLKRLAAQLSLKAVMEWIDNYLDGTNEKLIAYGIHRKFLKPLHERYKDICVFVDGSTSGKHRQLAVEEFNHKKKTRLFLGNLQAASQGWSATSCSTTVHLEMEWKPGPHMQGEDRCYGVGRGVEGQGTFAYYLVAQGTIMERICELLQFKQGNISAVLDGKKAEQTFNIFDQLVTEMMKGRAA